MGRVRLHLTGDEAMNYAQVAYEAYRDSTGGKTFDGRDMPSWEQVVERTPHVARAWLDAANAVLDAEAQERLNGVA